MESVSRHVEQTLTFCISELSGFQEIFLTENKKLAFLVASFAHDHKKPNVSIQQHLSWCH
jgi:hypothetical protein